MTDTIPYNDEINEVLKLAPDATPTDRETAAVQTVQLRAERMNASKAAIAWGCLGARNAVRAGESAHRAIEVGIARVTDIMESSHAP